MQGAAGSPDAWGWGRLSTISAARATPADGRRVGWGLVFSQTPFQAALGHSQVEQRYSDSPQALPFPSSTINRSRAFEVIPHFLIFSAGWMPCEAGRLFLQLAVCSVGSLASLPGGSWVPAGVCELECPILHTGVKRGS